MIYLIVDKTPVFSEFPTPFTHFYAMRRTYTLILSLLFALGTSQAFSQESITPLLRADTIAAAHLNLKNFDFYRFAESQVERVDSVFELLDYDEDSREAIAREVRTLITGKLNLIRPIYQMFIMSTKLEEIYVVFYASGQKVAAIVATPLEGKSASQIAMLESFFNDAPIKPFRFEGFLMLVVPISQGMGAEADEWMKGYLQKSEPAANLEAFEDMPEDAIFRAVVFKPENIEDLFASVGVRLSDAPPQALAVLNMILDKFQWVSFGFDPYAFSVGLTVQTFSETDAEELLELFKATQDAGIEALRSGMYAGIAQGAQDNPALFLFTEYVPLVTEIVRGAARKTLPVIDGTKLFFGLWVVY